MERAKLAANITCNLQKCRKGGHLNHAKHVHGHICNSGLEAHAAIENHIVPTFVGCGSLSDAFWTFNRLVYPNEHSWTSLILGHIECGQFHHALDLYQKMQTDSISPSSYTLTALLRACAKLKNVERGRKLHIEIRTNGFDKDISVGSTLVDMYAKCGSLMEAQKAFDDLPTRNVVCWTSLISGYAEHGFGQKALDNFEQMQLDGISPDAVTSVCSLRGCSSIGAICKGREIHSFILQLGFQRDLLVGSSLIGMYCKGGSLLEAEEVFNKLPIQELMSWNALILGYTENGLHLESVRCFQHLRLQGTCLNAATFVSTLKACGSMGALDKGREIHIEAERKGILSSLLLSSTLVDMYAKCGSLVEAQNVFVKMPLRDAVTWTAMIAGYAENGSAAKALNCYEEMLLDDMYPDAVTFISILKACGTIGAVDKSRQIHADIIQKGLGKDTCVGNTLVDVYAKCGSLAEAREVFEKLAIRNIVSWTTLIAGYVENGHGLEALKCFEYMQLECVSPNSVTFIWILKACTAVGAIDRGWQIYNEALLRGFEQDSVIGATLIDMFVKSGLLIEAQQIFEKLPIWDIVTWNTMIKGFGMNYEGKKAVECFEKMQERGIKPDATTFVSLLTACSRSGLVVKGQEYFKAMIVAYGIAPTGDHYSCMIDLLARTGKLHEAEKLLGTAPFLASEEALTALLSACKTYGQVEVGLRCFQHLVKSNPGHAASFIQMSNVYANGGQWDDANTIEEIRKQLGVKKILRKALIEVNRSVHEFVAEDGRTARMQEQLAS